MACCRQAIIWTNARILLTEILGTNFSEILIKIQNFSFTKMHLKISSAKWRPFYPGRDDLSVLVEALIRPPTPSLPRKSTHMMTLSIGNIFRVTGPLWGEFTGHLWPPPPQHTHKGQWRLSKQSIRRWFETPSHSLWRYWNDEWRLRSK